MVSIADKETTLQQYIITKDKNIERQQRKETVVDNSTNQLFCHLLKYNKHDIHYLS